MFQTLSSLSILNLILKTFPFFNTIVVICNKVKFIIYTYSMC